MKFQSQLSIAASLLALAFVAGCASEAKKNEATPGSAPAASSSSAPTPATGSAQPSTVTGNALNDPKSMLFKRSVYYEFDQSNVKTDYRSLVEAHARYLRDHPGATITIEGNCDERGSREYNLALGQRRADGVKGMMKVLGVPDRQVDTVSYGEEKPKAQGHDEGSWSQNRRSDIVYHKIQ